MPESDLDLLTRAARAAGEIALAHRARGLAPVEKPDGSGPVTAADLEIDTMLGATLRGARPDYGWLSEETPDDTARLTTQHQFICDPIDGTRAYVQGSRDWAHSLAVVRGGRVTAAAVYLPARETLYTAALGGGAHRNGQPIVVTAQADPARATLLANKPSVEARHWRAGVPPFKRAFRSSLAYRLCLVAEGQFDGMLSMRPTWEWDIAAGALIVAEAGGTVTEPTGLPLVFNSARAQSRHGILAAGALYPALAGALRPA